MAGSLEERLEDDEQVIYCTPMDGTPKSAHATLLVGIILGAGLGKFLLLLGADATLIAMLAGLWSYKVLRAATWDCTAEAMVTDRRVMHCNGWGGTLFFEVPLSEIREVDIRRNKIQATLASGEIRRLDHPHHARELTLALATAADLRPPLLPWPKEAVADKTILFGALIGGALTAALYVHVIAGDSDGSLTSLVALSMLVAISFCSGAVSGAFMGLYLLRPHFTPEEIQHWIRMSELLSPGFEAEHSQPRLKQFFATVASVIYDRPIQWED